MSKICNVNRKILNMNNKKNKKNKKQPKMTNRNNFKERREYYYSLLIRSQFMYS